MEEKPNYFAIIPAEVRYDNRLRANEKLLYGEITALTFKTGECWASNNYFAQLYETTPQAISRWVLNLKKFGYIDIDYSYKGKEIEKRIIKVSTFVDRYQQNDDGGINKCLEGYQQIVKENNTSINNTSINNICKRFKKPTLDEIETYIQDNSLNVNAQSFFDYYESNGWKVGHNGMKDYKATLRRWSRTNGSKDEKPSWMNKEIKKEELTKEEEQELNDLLEDFR